MDRDGRKPAPSESLNAPVQAVTGMIFGSTPPSMVSTFSASGVNIVW